MNPILLFKHFTKGFSFLMLVFSLTHAQAQNISFPSESEALSQLKASNSLASTLQKEYGINSISDLSFISDGSGFIAYYSNEGMHYSNRIPKDGCSMTFIASSKKNSEGISYKIPIIVNYSRLVQEDDYITVTNSWEYYNWELGSPTISGAKEITTALKVSLVYDALRKAEESGFNNQKAEMELYFYKLETCIKIAEIFQSEENLGEDAVISANEQIWNFNLVGDFAKTERNGSKMIYLDENLTYYIQLKVNKIDGKWIPKMIRVYNNSYGRQTPYEGDELYYTYKEIGLDGIFKKRSAKALPRNSEVYLDFYVKKFEDVVTSFSEDEAADLEKLTFFIEDEDQEIAKSIRNLYLELDRKQITRKSENYTISIYRDDNYKIRNAYLIVSFSMNRVNGLTDKTAGKKFLAAGMSKKALKSGKFYERYKQSWNLQFKDDRWYINEKMILKTDIPF